MVKKIFKAVGAFFALIIVAAVVVIVTVHPDELINAHKGDLSDAVSEAIGRKVVLGPVKSSFFPYLGAELRDVQIASASGEGPPQATLNRMVFKMRWLDALFSLGRNLRVKAFSADGLVVRIGRDAEGEWDFQDIIDHLSAGPVTPSDEEVSVFYDINLQRAALENSRIEIKDAKREKPLIIEDLRFVGKDVSIGKPLDVEFSTVFNDGNNRSPVSVKLYASELRKDSPLDPMPDVKFTASLENLGLSAWSRLLPADALRPAEGHITAEALVQVTQQGTDITLQGNAETKTLVLVKKGERGTPLSGKLRFEVNADTQAERYDIDLLQVEGAGVHIDGKLHANGTSLANLHDTSISLKVDNLPQTLAILPAKSGVLPPDLSLRGPLVANLEANQGQLKLSVDGNATDVRYGTQFQKPAGAPFTVDLKGTYEDTYLRIPNAKAQVGAVGIAGSLSLPIKDGVPYVINLQTGDIEVRDLKTILPDVSAALSSGRRVDGKFSLKVSATDKGGKQYADVDAALRNVAVQTNGLNAAGDADVSFQIHPQKGVTTIQGQGRFDSFALKATDDQGEVTLNKRGGERLRLDVDIERDGDIATIKTARLEAGETSLTATGTARGLDSDAGALDLRFGSVKVAFDDLRRMLPGAQSLPAGGRLTGQLSLSGPPTTPAKWAVKATGLDVAFGKTRLRGDATLSRLSPLAADVALKKSTLVYADILALDPTLDVVPRTSRFEGDATVTYDAERDDVFALTLDATRLVLDRDTALAGQVALKNLERPDIEAHLRGKSLNVDKAFPSEDDTSGSAPDENPDGLDASTRSFLRKMKARGDLKVDRLVYADETLRNVDAAFVLDGGKLALSRLTLEALGGRIDAAGTSADLAAQKTSYHVKAKTRDVSVGQTLKIFSDRGDAFEGRMSNDIDVTGTGLSGDSAASSLDGKVTMNTDSVKWKALDILDGVKRPLQTALQAKKLFDNFAGFALSGGSAATAQASAASSSSSGRGRRGRGTKRASSTAKRFVNGPTSFKDIRAWVTFFGGHFKLDKQLIAKTPFGAMSLGGGGGLDGTVDLTARATLSKQVLASTFGVNMNEGVSIPLNIKGSWKNPLVTEVDVSGLVSELAKQSGVGRAVDTVKNVVNSGVDAAKDTVRETVSGAQDAAQDAAKAAQERAAKAAADAKAETERRAREAAATAKKRAEDEARRIRERAEAEAKKRAAEAREKAKKAAAKKAKKLLGL